MKEMNMFKYMLMITQIPRQIYQVYLIHGTRKYQTSFEKFATLTIRRYFYMNVRKMLDQQEAEENKETGAAEEEKAHFKNQNMHNFSISMELKKQNLYHKYGQFMSKELDKAMPNDRMVKTYITTIDLRHYKEENLIIISSVHQFLNQVISFDIELLQSKMREFQSMLFLYEGLALVPISEKEKQIPMHECVGFDLPEGSIKHKLIDAGVYMFQTDWFSQKPEIENNASLQQDKSSDGFMGGSVDGFYSQMKKKCSIF